MSSDSKTLVDAHGCIHTGVYLYRYALVRYTRVGFCKFFDKIGFLRTTTADLLTEVRVFCVPIRDVYIANRYCGQMPEKTIIYASAHSKVKTNLYD